MTLLLKITMLAGLSYASENHNVSSSVIPPCNIENFLPDQAKVPCNLIVEFEQNVSEAERIAIVKSSGASKRHSYKAVTASAVTIHDISSYKKLVQHMHVKAVIPDRVVSISKKPSNPGGGKGNDGGNTSSQIIPAGIEHINAAPGILSVSGAGIGVAIVDTGLDMQHADLNIASECVFSIENSCMDANGHGTHVGGTVAAKNNTLDVVGVAPDATLYSVKVLDASGSGSDSTIMAGLDWILLNADLVTPKINVINMSLGRPGILSDNPLMHSLIQQLTDKNISVVVAAGNDSNLEVSQNVPATYPEVIAVASTTAIDGTNRCKRFNGFIAADTASYFTTDGAYDVDSGIGVTISAPGADRENINRGCNISPEGILSLNLGGGLTRMYGTSMAAPHVTGVVALMYQKYQDLVESMIKTYIRNSANKIGYAPYDSPTTSYTFDGEREGVISACAALSEC